MEGKEEGERGREKKNKVKGGGREVEGGCGPRLMESWC